MTSKFCKICGNKIPRHIPSSGRKTKRTRQRCYNCAPVRPSKRNGDHKSERRRRKEKLVKMLGGKCSDCGYNKSITALSFHHIEPKEKCFDISSNGNLMQEWEIVLDEAMKCKILCLNCHAELHNGH